MLFTTNSVRTEDLKETNNFFSQFDNEFEAVNVVNEQEIVETPVSKYISSLVCGQYAKAVEEIENTKVGNRLKRKRNLQQVMRESFFYGANRFGNNFIA